MSYSDAELIKRTLDGDETAFGFLVDKYKGAVHALAYRKVGDFHIAEEITQDTFLKAYQKLRTLREPKHFPGWLYVIAARCCISFNRKKRLHLQSIDSVDKEQIEALAWAEYEDKCTREKLHDALESLPESDRTVLTLYYLGGLTCEEIAHFMGTSRVAIKNRLYRARLRLKEEMITMIQKTFGTFQLPYTLTQRIMERIHHLKPTPAPNSKPSAPWKPLAPWVAVATTLVVLALFSGLSVMQSARFQAPYSLDGTESVMTVELTEDPFFEIPMLERTIANHFGTVNSGDFGIENQFNGSALVPVADTQEGEKMENMFWEQTNGPEGGRIGSLITTPDGTLFAVADAGIFRSFDNGDLWAKITDFSARTLAVLGDTIYAGRWDGVFRSEDGGKSWAEVNNGLTDVRIWHLMVKDKILYAATTNGVFRSENAGDSWIPMNTGLTDTVWTLLFWGKTLFAGTDKGVFRLEEGEDSWTESNTGLTELLFSVGLERQIDLDNENFSKELRQAFIDNRWGISPDVDVSIKEKGHEWLMTDKANGLTYVVKKDGDKLNVYIPYFRVRALALLGNTLYAGTRVGGIFHSMDGGNSWVQINTGLPNRYYNSFAVLGKTLYAGGNAGVFRLSENGDSWIWLNRKELGNQQVHALAVVNKTLYAGTFGGGIFRSTDGGESWTQINKGLTGSLVHSLAVIGANVYAGAEGNGLFSSTDGGKSWTRVNMGKTDFDIRAFSVLGKTLYAGGHGLFRSMDGGESWTEINAKGLTQYGCINSLAVIGTTLYAGATGGVFRSQDSGESWTQITTGLVGRVMALAVLGADLYAVTWGDGIFRLAVDSKSWTPVNTRLPHFSAESLAGVKALAVLGTDLYAGTTRGISRLSDDGNSWVPVNTRLESLYINSLAVLETTLFAGTDKGVFRLEEGENSWTAIDNSGLPNLRIFSLAVTETTLYAGTYMGVFRASLARKD